MSKLGVAMIGVWALAAGCQNEGIFLDEPSVYPLSDPQPPQNMVQTDQITQIQPASVDILFVIDNSCSMLEEQVALATNFPDFMNFFVGSGLDYHIGVVSTDMNDPLHGGRLITANGQRWIAPDDPDPSATFSQMANLGNQGHWQEQGRNAAYTALEVLGQSANLGFEREDSALHITVVSDEDDESGQAPVSRDEFVSWLENRKWNANMTTFSSIVGPAAGCPDVEEPGTDYLATTAAAGGIDWSICSPEWAQVLELLGLQASGLTREFFLSQLPNSDTIEVIVTTDEAAIPFEQGNGYTYDQSRNSIVFDEFIPPALSQVTIRYVLFSTQSQDGTLPETMDTLEL